MLFLSFDLDLTVDLDLWGSHDLVQQILYACFKYAVPLIEYKN